MEEINICYLIVAKILLYSGLQYELFHYSFTQIYCCLPLSPLNDSFSEELLILLSIQNHILNVGYTKYLSDWQVSMTVLVTIFKYILYSKDREDVNLVSTTIEFYEEESTCIYTDVSLFCKS